VISAEGQIGLRVQQQILRGLYEAEKSFVEQVRVQQKAKETAVRSERQVKNLVSFIAYLCHEIRNPVHGVLGGVNVLSSLLDQLQAVIKQHKDTLPPDTLRQVDSIRSQLTEVLTDISTCVGYQTSILNDNLDIARMAQGKLVLDSTKQLNLCRLLYQVMKMFKASATQKGLSFKLILPTPRHQIHGFGDAARIQQVVSNLVTNAIKFTERGSIEIVLKANLEELCGRDPTTFDSNTAASTMEIIVTDTGIGLTEDEVNALFERFGQGNVSSYGGSGLGLFFSKNLAKLMGGDLVIKSVKNKGTSFHFFFKLDKCHCGCMTSSKHVSAAESDETLSSSFGVLNLQSPQQKLNKIAEKLQHMDLAEELFPSKASGSEWNTSLDFVGGGTSSPVPSQLSASGSTTVFSVSPRLWKPSSTTPSSLDENSTVANVTSTTSSVKRILVVDDNDINRKLLGAFLRATPHEIHYAKDGEEALRMYLSKPFHLILMDLIMPNLDGIQTTAIIRQIEKGKGSLPKIPIVVISALESLSDDLSKVGGDDFVGKPFNKDQILRIVSRWIT